jgi:hypothetical protein
MEPIAAASSPSGPFKALKPDDFLRRMPEPVIIDALGVYDPKEFQANLRMWRSARTQSMLQLLSNKTLEDETEAAF